MECGQCGAEIMLGASACERCGWSPLGNASVPIPTDLAGDDPVLSGQVTGAVPPPPPPPSAVPLAPPPSAYATAPAARPVPPPKGGSSGAGCVGVVVLIAIAVVGGGIFAALRGADVADDVRDAVEPARLGFDGDRVTGEPIQPSVAVSLVELDTGEVSAHSLDGLSGTVTIRAFEAESFDPVIRVVDADGRVLGEDDDSGISGDSLLTVELPAGPGNVLLVRNFSGLPGVFTAVAVAGDGTTPDVTVGVPLTVGPPAGGLLVDADGSVEHPFTGTGAEVTITVRAVADLDPIVTVIDASGAVLIRNDDFEQPVSRDAQVALTIAAGQVVTVEVTAFGSAAGPYVITVEPSG